MPGFPAGVHKKGGAVSAVVNREAARAFYEPLLPIVAELHSQGLSLRAIARELDLHGIKTRQEWPHWSAMQVSRILARALAAEAAARRAKAVELLGRCRAAGVSLNVENGKLYFSATDEARQDAALIEEVSSDEYDAELIALVTGADEC